MSHVAQRFQLAILSDCSCASSEPRAGQSSSGTRELQLSLLAIRCPIRLIVNIYFAGRRIFLVSGISSFANGTAFSFAASLYVFM